MTCPGNIPGCDGVLRLFTSAEACGHKHPQHDATRARLLDQAQAQVQDWRGRLMAAVPHVPSAATYSWAARVTRLFELARAPGMPRFTLDAAQQPGGPTGTFDLEYQGRKSTSTIARHSLAQLAEAAAGMGEYLYGGPVP